MVHQGCRGLAFGVGGAVTDQFSTIWACGTRPGQSQGRLAYQFSDVLPREQAHARAARRATPRDSTRATPPHPAARAVPLDARPMPPRCFFSGSRTPRTRHCVLATSRRGARPRRRTHVCASSFHPLPPRTACGACRASAAPLGLAHTLALVLRGAPVPVSVTQRAQPSALAAARSPTRESHSDLDPLPKYSHRPQNIGVARIRSTFPSRSGISRRSELLT